MKIVSRQKGAGSRFIETRLHRNFPPLVQAARDYFLSFFVELFSLAFSSFFDLFEGFSLRLGSSKRTIYCFVAN